MPLRLRSERGFTTVTLMGVLLVGGMLVMASFAAVDPDIRMTRNDRDSKQAYAAAESGLQWYLNQLANNNAYYTLCENPPAPNATEAAPVNQKYGTATAKPFTWRRLPGEQAKYAIELMPADGSSACTSNQYSMVDRYGNLRLRISGRSRGVTRTLLATLRRRNFMDYIYFSHFETFDPVTYSDVAGATAACAKFRAERASWCDEITWVTGDDQLGPVHSNDNFQVCGDPQFGRSSTDAIELNGPEPFISSGSCGADPDVEGTLVHPAGQLEMPPSNAAIETLALSGSGYHFVGRTDIQLNGTLMNVKNENRWGDNNFHSLSLPANGVIYVANETAGCLGGYDRDDPYGSDDEECGNVWVKGSYGRDLTVAADNDVVITGSLTHATDELLLGLVANNFVRVYRPSSWSGCSSALSDVVIQAAILALQHSFIVDNYDCAGNLGNLNVEGAIAQRFRGPVGTTGGRGYTKNYEYNDRLRYREPPYFLDPVEAAWRISRQSEQLPPMKNLP